MLLQPVGHQFGGGLDRVFHLNLGNIELHDAGVDGGEIEDVVDDGEQHRRGGTDMVQIFLLLGGERPRPRQRQQFGEADDVGQRRAQFVGHMLDEIVLELIRLQECVVLILQRPLDIDAVRHVDKGEHHLAVRQMDDGVAQRIAVLQRGLAVVVAAFVVKACDGRDEARPRPVLGATGAKIADGGDVNGRQHGLRRQFPHLGECGVGQAQPAIRPEHGDALGEVVERFTLHAHCRLVAALEIDLLGQVLENPGDAPLRLRIADDANGLAVRQVPPVLHRLD